MIWQKFLCASPLLDRAFCSQGWLQIRPISKYGLECLILLPVPSSLLELQACNTRLGLYGAGTEPRASFILNMYSTN